LAACCLPKGFGEIIEEEQGQSGGNVNGIVQEEVAV